MKKEDLSLDKQKQLELYCGNKECILVGHIFELDRKKFKARFERKGQTDLMLEQKIKKLNLKQKSLIGMGHVVKLDFNSGKLYIMGTDMSWY